MRRQLLPQPPRLFADQPGLGQALGGGLDRGEQAEQGEQRAEHPEREIEGAGGSDPYSSGSIYLEVTKTGDIYTTSFSSDGINWTVLGTETDATAYDEIGLFLGKHLAK